VENPLWQQESRLCVPIDGQIAGDVINRDHAEPARGYDVLMEGSRRCRDVLHGRRPSLANANILFRRHWRLARRFIHKGGRQLCARPDRRARTRDFLPF
jgi:hypothetical protein